MEDALCKVA